MFRMIPALVLLGAFALGIADSAAQALKAQTNSQSGVTVKATPKNLQGDVWDFELVFDTHSQELSDDLLKSAVLVTADGKHLAPVAWSGDPPSGHHRKGVLRFNALKPPTDVVELRVTRTGEPAPRVFRWKSK